MYVRFIANNGYESLYLSYIFCIIYFNILADKILKKIKLNKIKKKKKTSASFTDGRKDHFVVGWAKWC